MPDIASIGHGSVGPLNRPGTTPDMLHHRNGLAPARPGSDAASSRDRVELSDHARYLGRLRELPGVRIGRVAEARSAIIEGTYETEHKLNIAVDRLLEDLDLTTD
jgi:hypothetical protein